MILEIKCPYCKEMDRVEIESAVFHTEVLCEDLVGKPGCDKKFYVDGEATAYHLTYYTNRERKNES